MNFLIIDDDDNISFAIKKYLEKFNHKAFICMNIEATSELEIENFDFVILDLNLPDESGFEYLKYLREGTNVPVLILTVRDQEQDILKAFDLGADDYLTKPFSLPILKARIDSIFKRLSSYEKSYLNFGELVLYTENKTAYLEDNLLDLGAIEYELLEILIKNQGLTLPRERILEKLWYSEKREVGDNALSVAIKRLRDKLGDYGKYINTVRGIGYCWENEL
jgi:DNA-binding response OmpR family regulator